MTCVLRKYHRCFLSTEVFGYDIETFMSRFQFNLIDVSQSKLQASGSGYYHYSGF